MHVSFRSDSRGFEANGDGGVTVGVNYHFKRGNSLLINKNLISLKIPEKTVGDCHIGCTYRFGAIHVILHARSTKTTTYGCSTTFDEEAVSLCARYRINEKAGNCTRGIPAEVGGVPD